MADYIIVGAGVFGVSAALYLATSDPDANILLIDRARCPYPSAASSDLNKIIRADYDDIFYMRLALEALEKWNTDPLYEPYFHKTGMLFAEDLGMGDSSFNNYKLIGIDPGAEILTPGQARERFPVFKNANWTDVKDNYYNPCSGWGEADPAVRAVIEAALAAGVKYVQTTVERLVFDDQGACIGIKTVDGDEIRARSILLCSGAWTAQLVADSDPCRKDIQVNGRMVAAAAASCIVQCDPEHLSLYRDAPVHFLGMPHTHGESIPATADGKLKFNFEVSFTNMEYHEASGQMISVPPVRITQSTWSHDVPEQLKQSVRKVVDHVYGKNAPGLTVESYRMCWDAVTPNQDWIISPHPACKGLYIAGGGSFHSWKFLPTIGKYVTRMLKGELTSEQAEKWAWDRKNEGAACVMYIPQNDLKDFVET
ncbi:uncharacterized protein PV07_01772 [Cladophialophora immunda]|uniref:FAD dependent oxidoreductase domain-containing protein n=1 Tax=Cladophialophora immunda TaxID=569365 RepID=A0A0D2A444_9EURO|nr:uncharacterized protein PV07_01772 [Cladophialophora immunda]KIW35046.1 hypothetical protein PV07_01772 [Cladophialophora immunda]